MEAYDEIDMLLKKVWKLENALKHRDKQIAALKERIKELEQMKARMEVPINVLKELIRADNFGEHIKDRELL